MREKADTLIPKCDLADIYGLCLRPPESPPISTVKGLWCSYEFLILLFVYSSFREAVSGTAACYIHMKVNNEATSAMAHSLC